MKRAALAALLVSIGLASNASAAEPSVVIASGAAPKAMYPKAVARGIREALSADDIQIVGFERLERVMKKRRVKRRARLRPDSLAEAARAIDVDYVLRVTFKREKRAFVARAVLIHQRDGVLLDLRTRYDDPRSEAKDRGRRIGYGVLARIGQMEASAPSPVAAASRRPEAEEAPAEVFEPAGAPSEDAFGAADEDAFFADADGATELALELPTAGAFHDEPDSFAFAGVDWTLRGYASATYRGFYHPELDEGKSRNFSKVGVRPTLTGRIGDSWRLRFLPRIELSVIEPRLHRAMIEEGFVEYATERFELRVGFDALSWGAASSINIADVINARDFSEGFSDAPKIGQPMLSTRFFFGNHSLTLLYMTPFVAPRFAPPDSPFSPFDVDVGDSYGAVIFGATAGAWQPQGAARLAFSFHRLDLRASYFYGYRRTPIAHQPTDSLVFPLVHNASVEAQMIFGQTIVKIEASSLWHQPTDLTEAPPIRLDNGALAAPILLPGHRFAWVVGVEHTFDEVAGKTTLVLVSELLGDSDSELFTDDIPPDDTSRFFSNHAAVGLRWSLNNDVDSTIELSDLADITSISEHLLRIEYSQRWLDHWTFAVGGQLGIAEDGTKMTGFRKLSGMFSEVRFNY